MNKRKYRLLVLLAVMSSPIVVFASSALKSHPALVLPGKAGHFDFMAVDAARGRLLAAHKGTGTLALVNLRDGKVLSALPVGEVQGVAVDPRSATYVLGDEGEHKVVFVSAKTLKITGEVPVSGPVDAVAVDPRHEKAYADEDDGSHVWVINEKTHQLVSTIKLPGVPEFVAYDPKTNRVYQNIKSKNLVAVINPATYKIEAEWPTAPASGPHGSAVDLKSEQLFVAGHNGKLVAIALKSGKVVSQADIAPGTDQIAFDAKDKTIYCASRGFVSAVKVTKAGLKAIGNTPDHKWAHNLAVDSKRNSVWISYADRVHSYLQRLTK